MQDVEVYVRVLYSFWLNNVLDTIIKFGMSQRHCDDFSRPLRRVRFALSNEEIIM